MRIERTSSDRSQNVPARSRLHGAGGDRGRARQRARAAQGRVPGAQRRQRRDPQDVRAGDRRGPRRRLHAGLVAVHHRARSVPRGPARAAAVPAQVRAQRRPVGRPAPGQHQPRSDDRRRARRFVRRLPRPPARLGRPRRQHVHAARQPRRAPPVRRRAAGDARRRDHHRAAPDPRRRDRHRAQHAHDPDRRPDLVEGAELRTARPCAPTAASTRRASRASTPICACVRSWRRVG